MKPSKIFFQSYIFIKQLIILKYKKAETDIHMPAHKRKARKKKHLCYNKPNFTVLSSIVGF